MSTKVVSDTKKPTLQGIDRPHNAVRHSAGEYVRDMARTNGIESHWALLKRGIVGAYHHIGAKHLDRYTTEFEGRHNSRPDDTIDQIQGVIAGMGGKRLRYDDLISG